MRNADTYVPLDGRYGQPKEKKEAAKKEFLENIELLEEELGDKAFFGGETLHPWMDVALIPFYTVNEKFGNFQCRGRAPKVH